MSSSASSNGWWLAFAIASALTAALSVVFTKAGLEKVPPSLSFALQAILILAISWAVAGFSGETGEIGSIEKRNWWFLIAAGVATTASSLLNFQALKMADAAQVNPIERLSLVFTIILAAIFLKEKLTWQIILGAVMMVGGAVVIALAKKE